MNKIIKAGVLIATILTLINIAIFITASKSVKLIVGNEVSVYCDDGYCDDFFGVVDADGSVKLVERK